MKEREKDGNGGRGLEGRRYWGLGGALRERWWGFGLGWRVVVLFSEKGNRMRIQEFRGRSRGISIACYCIVQIVESTRKIRVDAEEGSKCPTAQRCEVVLHTASHGSHKHRDMGGNWWGDAPKVDGV